jgi:sacsin
MTDFEQGETFTDRLRGILEEYPPGVSILKELLQNADDAGAKLIVILWQDSN